MHRCRRADRRVALALTACGAAPEQSAIGTDRCSSVIFPALQGGEHLIGDQQPPVPYGSIPPTSGWHSSGAFEISVRPVEDPLPEAKQVSVLEAGGVVITYDEALPPADRRQLEEKVRNQYDGRVAVTPYHKLAEGQVVFTAWGALQRCDGLDLDAFDAFVSVYADEDPAAPGHR